MSFQEFKPFRGPDAITGKELDILCALAAGQRDIGTHALEIGTYHGTTTTSIARMLPRHKIITVSMPKGGVPLISSTPSDAAFFGTVPVFGDDVKDRIEHLQCDSATLDFSDWIAFGFVFIDGAHSTEYVLNDFLKVIPFLAIGGLIVLHDYGTDNLLGITAVRVAVDKLMEDYGHWDWVRYAETSLIWVKV